MGQDNNAQSVSGKSANEAEALREAEGLEGLAKAGGVTPQTTMSTKINSLEELRKVSPKLYQAILQGIAQNMMIDFRRRQDRLEEEMKKMRRNER